jgi:hypothetical protein
MADSTPFEGIFYIPQICDMGPTSLLALRRKACWGFFRSEKSDGFGRVRTLEPGVPEASMLTPRPPKPPRGFNSPMEVTQASDRAAPIYSDVCVLVCIPVTGQWHWTLWICSRDWNCCSAICYIYLIKSCFPVKIFLMARPFLIALISYKGK